MSSVEVTRDPPETKKLHALFCLGVLPALYEEPADRFDELMVAFRRAFADMASSFGLLVLGSLDDIELQMGPSVGFPWTGYLLAEIKTIEAASDFVRHLTTVRIGPDLLWKYLRIEVRIGPPLDFVTR